MNRTRSLLKFSSPARALKKFTSPAGTFPKFSDEDPTESPPEEPYNPPGSFVTLCCTDTSTEAYVFRYADGLKVHNIAFGHGQALRMTNSCDGLVGIYGHDDFWIANPSIPRVAALQRCSPHVCWFRPRENINRFDMPHAAIGLADASTGEHKVVRMFVRELAGCHPISLGCEVLSLEKESRRFWKKVDDPPVYPIAMVSLLPLVVDGIVYWTVRTTPGMEFNTTKIRSKFRMSVVALCFNLREEKFSLLHHPKEWAKKESPRWSNLFLLEGRPCLVDAYPWTGRITVWSLEDHVSSEWISRRNFCVKDFRRDICSHNKKVYYELPTMDVDDVETMRLLYNVTNDNVHDDSLEDEFTFGMCSKIMEYRASYTDSNFWPF